MASSFSSSLSFELLLLFFLLSFLPYTLLPFPSHFFSTPSHPPNSRSFLSSFLSLSLLRPSSPHSLHPSSPSSLSLPPSSSPSLTPFLVLLTLRAPVRRFHSSLNPGSLRHCITPSLYLAPLLVFMVLVLVLVLVLLMVLSPPVSVFVIPSFPPTLSPSLPLHLSLRQMISLVSCQPAW